MFEPFVPPTAQLLRDPEAIALLQQLRRCPIPMPGWEIGAVNTAFVAANRADQLPLLLLHGFDSSLLEFRRLLPRLPSRWPAYAIDLLGAGFTDCPAAIAVTPQTIRQHLYSSWRALINRPVALVGASLGGAVAIDFALAYPDCVARLVLVNSVGFSGSFTLGPWLPAPLLERGADWLRWRKETAFLALDALPWFDHAGLRDSLLCASLHQQVPGWQRAIVSFTQSGGYQNLAARIAGITQPTLILWGDRDTTLGTADADRFKQTIADSRLVWIRGAGHVPHIEQPRAVAKALANSLLTTL